MQKQESDGLHENREAGFSINPTMSDQLPAPQEGVLGILSLFPIVVTNYEVEGCTRDEFFTYENLFGRIPSRHLNIISLDFKIECFGCNA